MLYVFGKFGRDGENPLEKIAVYAACAGVKTAVFGQADEETAKRLGNAKTDVDGLVPYPPDETEIEEVLERITDLDAVVTDLSGEIETTKFVLSQAGRKRALTVLAFPSFAVPEAVAVNCDAAIFDEKTVNGITGYELNAEVGVALAVSELYSAGFESAVILTDRIGAVAAENDRITYIDEKIADGAEFVVRFVRSLSDGAGVTGAARLASENLQRRKRRTK